MEARPQARSGQESPFTKNKQLTMQRRYKLRGYCSNNQAEQTAILKALEQLQEMETPSGGRAAIYTDSKVTLNSLKNHDIEKYETGSYI